MFGTVLGSTHKARYISLGAGVDAICSWELRGIDMSQAVPNSQLSDDYTLALDLVLTIVAH